MSGSFCPECGAQCSPDDKACHDCRFPLEIHITQDTSGVHIQRDQLERWKRIIQLLKRGGVRVQVRTIGSKSLIWWLLPIAGALLFLCTLLFGSSMVNAIWAPPKAARAVLDLNNPNPEAQPAAQAPDEDRDNIEFLSEALRLTPEQEQTANAELDLDAYIDKPIASNAEILEAFKSITVTVTVEERRMHGTVLDNKSQVLVDTKLLENAFQRKIRTVSENHKITEKEYWTLPSLKSSYTNKTSTGALVIGDEAVGLSLLSNKLGMAPVNKVNFTDGVTAGETVWITKDVKGTFYPEKVSVISPVTFAEDVNVWVLAVNLGSTYSGAPVLNKYGELVGVLLHFNDETTILPLSTMRERAPIIFKYLDRED